MNQAKGQAVGSAGAKPSPTKVAADRLAGQGGDGQSDAAYAREVLRVEAEAIGRIEITPAFDEAIGLILGAGATADGRRRDVGGGIAGGGTVVVSGLGKSGLIGQKISATLASTGTPSHFLHPTEALHGDLGRVRRGDVVLILSFGGSTEEVVTLATILKQDRVSVIAIVGQDRNDLARLATVVLCVGDVTEACPLNLAPTASTTAMLALGDALAMAVSRRRSFSVDDFRKVHPGGVLGRKLMPVVDAMRFRADQNLPLVSASATVAQAIGAEAPSAGARRAGAVLVVDTSGKLVGIFTDGDLRRLLVREGNEGLSQPVSGVMSANPRRLTDASLVRDAVQMVREYRIDELPVVDAQGRPLGLLDVQDLIALKVIEE